MQIAFIARATLFTVRGGDTLQVIETARCLSALGIAVDVKLAHERIDYGRYDLLHFFNIIRPADILYHIRKCRKPFVVSTLLTDYSGYDRRYRKGLPGFLFRSLSPDNIEYVKTIARYLAGRDKLISVDYLWKGHDRSIREILSRASMLFTGSDSEYHRLGERYTCATHCIPIPNGLDPELFRYDETGEKDDLLIVCAARIEGVKNQLHLIRALNNTKYHLLIIGSHAPNQLPYYRECRKTAASNVQFMEHIPQRELAKYYQKAKVHVLPSWFETCGLSSLEAGAMGCNIVITDKGYTRDYYGDDAFYCDPGDLTSIRNAVDRAAAADSPPGLRRKILANYTWDRTAASLAGAYDKILNPI